MCEQIGQQVMSMIVPHARRWTRIAAHNYFERRVWRVRRKILVRIHVDIRRMVDRQQTNLIEVDCFLEAAP